MTSGFRICRPAPSWCSKRWERRTIERGPPSGGSRGEMSEPNRSRELDLLAALSRQTTLSLGCYCEDESRCDRSVLRELLAERGADIV